MRGFEGKTSSFEQQRQRRHDADEAWDALRPAAARQQSESDLGLPEARGRNVRADAIVAGEGDFGPAAECGSGHRGHEGFAARLHAPRHRVQVVDRRGELVYAVRTDLAQIESHDEIAL